MLVLTRRSGESIVIGNDVVVTVLEVRNDQVRIGIQAPRSVQVHREEVYQQISRENAAAVASAQRAKSLLGRLPEPGLRTAGRDRQPGAADNQPGAEDQAPASNRTGVGDTTAADPAGP